MGIKYFIVTLGLIFLMACGGQVTEVANPVNPNDTNSGKKKFESLYYSVKMDLPADWSFIEFKPGMVTGKDVFKDIDDPQTNTMAFFFKKDLVFITVFYSELKEGQILSGYFNDRHPKQPYDSTKIEDPNGNIAHAILYYPEESGPHDGFVFELYLEVEKQILWMHAELAGEIDEIENNFEEFKAIVQSTEIII